MRRLALLGLAAGAACGPAPEPPRDAAAGAPAPPEPREARFRFVDVTEERGLGSFRQESGRPDKPTVLESIGGGVAFLDYDGDGWSDAYLTNGGHLTGDREAPRDALYRNEGGDFRDVTAELGLGDEGWTCGVRAADVDGDGWTDLYLTNWGPNALLMNESGGRFADRTGSAGVGDPRWSTGACFVDGDRDGDLDLYVANYVEFDADRLPPEGQEYKGVRVYYGPRGMTGARDTYYRNLGDGTFEDATVEAGVADSDGYGFQVVAFDHDQDGIVDLYVANDSTPNYLWRGDGAGRFEDRAFSAGVALSKEGMEQAGMGVAVGDATGDGQLDLFVTNFSEDYFTFYRNDGRGLFSDATVRAGLARDTVAALGWGCGFADFDLDADRDLYAVNGHVYPQVDAFDLGTSYRQRNQVFENLGGGEFSLAPAGPAFEQAEASRGSALGDYDNDGDLDLLVGNLDGRPSLLENRSERRGRWLLVELDPGPGRPTPVGARVAVAAGGRELVAPVAEASSFLSTNDPRVHFGLGEIPEVEALTVEWPGGERQVFRDVPVDRWVEVRRGSPSLTLR